MTSVSRELVGIFFASNALKKDSGVGDVPVTPIPVRKLGILGAGFMGAGIASIAVQRGTLVRLKDADLARVGKGLAAIRGILKEGVVKRRTTRQEMEDQLLLAGGTADYSGFGNVDLVIEAVFEDLYVKHQVLREVEAVIPAFSCSRRSLSALTRFAIGLRTVSAP